MDYMKAEIGDTTPKPVPTRLGKKTVTVEVKIRNTKKEGFVTIHVKASTASAVKEEVIKELQSSWTKKGFVLKPEHILLFRVEYIDNEAAGIEPIVGDGLKSLASDATAVDEEKKEENTALIYKYVAFEYFERVPEDLFRTIPLNKIHTATFTHPDYVEPQRTLVSPLYCAEFSVMEQPTPFYRLKKGGALKVFGVSLRCAGQETPSQGDINPFGPMGENEGKGETIMPLEQYDELFAKGECDPTFGILRTKASHIGQTNTRRSKNTVPDGEKEGRKQNNLATTRTTWIRYALKKGEDLACHGVAVVYDNSSPNHVSLVRIYWDESARARRWICSPALEVFLPFELEAACHNTENRQTVLRDQVFQLSQNEPETFNLLSSDYFGGNLIMPKLASRFVHYDLKMEASAEPLPLEGGFDYGDDGRRTVYVAALLLFHLGLGLHVAAAIEGLENKVQYVVGDLDQSHRETLLEALEDVASSALDLEFVAKHYLEMDWIAAEDALDTLKEVLR